MCLLCVEFQKGNMTIQEAVRALDEIINDPEAVKSADWWHMVGLDEADNLEEMLSEYKRDD